MSFQNELIEEVTTIITALTREGDRGCVLVAAALLENAIENEITARLVEHQDKNDLLMSRSGNSPVSTFSAKIELSYRIGICTNQERKLYHQLRNLRNDCAHRTDEQDFSKISFRHRIENIISESDVVWHAIKSKFETLMVEGDPSDSVHEFVNKIGWRQAFTLFFAFVIAYKSVNVKAIPRIEVVRHRAQGK